MTSSDRIVVAWALFTGVVAISVGVFVVARVLGRRVNFRWFLQPGAWAVLVLGLAAAWANPFVGAHLSSMHLTSLKRVAAAHVGGPATGVIAACGAPASQSDTELVYDSPWYASYPMQLRVLLANGAVLASYVDD